MYEIHNPVLLNEVLDKLKPKKGESLVDFTAGYGGHSGLILDTTGNFEGSYLIDRDSQAIDYLKNIAFKNKPVNIQQKDFYQASIDFFNEKKKFDIILADLGVSSLHINDHARGFSFRNNGPLDMRMDQSQQKDAGYVLNTYPEYRLAEILKEYGEEPKAKKIARYIVESRPIQSTSELADLCAKAWPGHSKTNPATRTFQAIRIEVNQELGQLSDSLPIWINLLKSGGRLAIISFHSLEDRIVKKFFNDNSGERYDAKLTLITKKPITAGQNEIVSNPRSRSAKLRVVVKK